VSDDDFTRLLAEEPRGGQSPDAPAPTRGRVVVAGVVVTGLLGIAVIAVGLGVGGLQAPPRVIATPTGSPAPIVEAAEVKESQPSRAVASRADPLWIETTSKRAGIPSRALAAYAGAALLLSEENPACGLGWNTLAAIGHVESEHGTIDGSTLDATGHATPAITGIALDGGEVEAIRDTDDGALDGDPVWDRAVGPMQFIPATWSIFASDGDGDGIEDPQQIDDAALTAARYLCSVSYGSLGDPDVWIAAVAAYNDSVEYNNRVAHAANHYATTG
jgi:membrane-bound lytic murein transglycosylase B